MNTTNTKDPIKLALEWVARNYAATLAGKPVRDADECLAHAQKILQPAAAQPQGDAREAFEAAYRRLFAKRWVVPQYQDMFRRNGDGYAENSVDDLWQMWQAASTQASEPSAHLLSLLARIHRDGGHYLAEHGLEKAVTDADIKVAKLNAMVDAAPARAVEPLTLGDIDDVRLSLRGTEFDTYDFAHAVINAFCRKNGIGIPATQAAQGGEA